MRGPREELPPGRQLLASVAGSCCSARRPSAEARHWAPSTVRRAWPAGAAPARGA
eukprot:CAMPEP_0171248330 /NCGR_PEP_ID=MMETSP0790-20130122/48960_1 /TAXON_ID=2925 /ORGANISM="Alexandrium catenella, Strain OF101" /LENGTH=54 /DNA_ID=CAMNT_0011715777 /DNA_START=79 /DNA_END=239 /DNA_ORIENTATION=+